MQIRNNNDGGFSIIVAIFMVGFLLVLTSGVFHLVLREMKDNQGAENYLKAYAGAEGAMELGLLEIKKEGYGIDSDLKSSASGSEVLSFGTTFLKGKEPKITYEMDIATDSLSGSLEKGETVIIPLFSNNVGIISPEFKIIAGGEEDVIWNIIGEGEGLGGSGKFISSDEFSYRTKTNSIENITVKNFLKNNSHSYLLLFNKGALIQYTLNSIDGKNFSKPVGAIHSSVQIGKYRQNIKTVIDNTEFLKMLKYSLYSK